MFWKQREVISQDPNQLFNFMLRAAFFHTHQQSELHKPWTSPPWHLPTQHQPSWHRKQQTPQKAAWLLTVFPSQAFSTAISMTLKLWLSCVRVRSRLICSQQNRIEIFSCFFFFFFFLVFFFFIVTVRSMFSACWQLHVLLPICKCFLPEGALRNAFIHSCRTWRCAGAPAGISDLQKF